MAAPRQYPTDWILCSDAEATVSLAVELGGQFAREPTAVKLAVGTEILTSDPSLGAGEPLTLGTSYFTPSWGEVGLAVPPDGVEIGRLKVAHQTDDDMLVMAGVLQVVDRGIWPVTCQRTDAAGVR